MFLCGPCASFIVGMTSASALANSAAGLVQAGVDTWVGSHQASMQLQAVKTEKIKAEPGADAGDDIFNSDIDDALVYGDTTLADRMALLVDRMGPWDEAQLMEMQVQEDGDRELAKALQAAEQAGAALEGLGPDGYAASSARKAELMQMQLQEDGDRELAQSLLAAEQAGAAAAQSQIHDDCSSTELEEPPVDPYNPPVDDPSNSEVEETPVDEALPLDMQALLKQSHADISAGLLHPANVNALPQRVEAGSGELGLVNSKSHNGLYQKFNRRFKEMLRLGKADVTTIRRFAEEKHGLFQDFADVGKGQSLVDVQAYEEKIQTQRTVDAEAYELLTRAKMIKKYEGELSVPEIDARIKELIVQQNFMAHPTWPDKGHMTLFVDWKERKLSGEKVSEHTTRLGASLALDAGSVKMLTKPGALFGPNSQPLNAFSSTATLLHQLAPKHNALSITNAAASHQKMIDEKPTAKPIKAEEEIVPPGKRRKNLNGSSREVTKTPLTMCKALAERTLKDAGSASDWATKLRGFDVCEKTVEKLDEMDRELKETYATLQQKIRAGVKSTEEYKEQEDALIALREEHSRTVGYARSSYNQLTSVPKSKGKKN